MWIRLFLWVRQPRINHSFGMDIRRSQFDQYCECVWWNPSHWLAVVACWWAVLDNEYTGTDPVRSCQMARPYRDHGTSLAPSSQMTLGSDRKARVQIGKLRRSYRESFQLIRMGSSNWTAKRYELTRWNAVDGIDQLRLDQGNRWSEWHSHSRKCAKHYAMDAQCIDLIKRNFFSVQSNCSRSDYLKRMTFDYGRDRPTGP